MSGRYARRLSPYEESEQMALARYLDVLGVLWCHVPNEGRFSISYLAKRAKLGVKAGVPDVLIFTPAPLTGRFVALELKSADPRAKVQITQEQWLAALERNGWHAAVCFGAAKAIEWLQGLGYRTGGQQCAMLSR